MLKAQAGLYKFDARMYSAFSWHFDGTLRGTRTGRTGEMSLSTKKSSCDGLEETFPKIYIIIYRNSSYLEKSILYNKNSSIV